MTAPICRHGRQLSVCATCAPEAERVLAAQLTQAPAVRFDRLLERLVDTARELEEARAEFRQAQKELRELVEPLLRRETP